MSSENKREVTVTPIERGHDIRAERAHAADMADHAILSPKAWDVVNKIGNIVKHNKKNRRRRRCRRTSQCCRGGYNS